MGNNGGNSKRVLAQLNCYNTRSLRVKSSVNLEIVSASADLFVRTCNGILISFCHLLALIVIAIGVVRAFFVFLSTTVLGQQTFEGFQRCRLMMGYSFSLGLSFLIGASILKTTVSSQWNDIAQLGIVIVIRTALNLLLERANKIGHAEIFHAEKAISSKPDRESVPG